MFLEISQNSQENTCAQVFSCEFCEIFDNTVFIENLRTTASEVSEDDKLESLTVCN